MDEIVCPFCETEFSGEEWVDGECPNCNKPYWWEKSFSEDFSDAWVTVEWEWWSIEDEN